MKVLFVMLNLGYVRNYDPTLRQLLERGHRLHIAYQASRNKMGENVMLDHLIHDWPEVTTGPAPEPEDGYWRVLARTARALLDYTRYLDPCYRDAHALRDRVKTLLPPQLVRFADTVAWFGEPVRRGFMRVLQWAEWRVPRSRVIADFIREQRPDCILVTPLVEPFSSQVDYVKEAAYSGIPSALCVASWDNLTNKGHARVVPDRAFLWNASQRKEAVDLHGMTEDQVVITGAQLFDQWFTWQPTRTREEFCRDVGLDPAVPYVLYLGSSFFIAPNEAEFVDRWLRALRRGPAPVSGFGVLIRPHPNNAQQFLGPDFSLCGNVAIWPPFGQNFFAHSSRQDFYDSLRYSAVVVGVNTSALIEAAILGKLVCTVLAPDFAHSQEGTLHFQLLTEGETPLLRVAHDFDTHFRHLGEAIAPTADDLARLSAFVQDFVRPAGLDVPAARVLADRIEELATLELTPRQTNPLDGLGRLLLALPTAAAGIVWRQFQRRKRTPVNFADKLARWLAEIWVGWQVIRYQGIWGPTPLPAGAPRTAAAPRLVPDISEKEIRRERRLSRDEKRNARELARLLKQEQGKEARSQKAEAVAAKIKHAEEERRRGAAVQAANREGKRRLAEAKAKRREARIKESQLRRATELAAGGATAAAGASVQGGAVGVVDVPVYHTESKEDRRKRQAARRAAEERERAEKQRELDEKLQRKTAERDRKVEEAQRRRAREPLWTRIPMPLRERLSQSRLTVYRWRKRMSRVGAITFDRARRVGRQTVRQLRHLKASFARIKP